MANTIGLLKSDDGPPEGRQYCPEGVQVWGKSLIRPRPVIATATSALLDTVADGPDDTLCDSLPTLPSISTIDQAKALSTHDAALVHPAVLGADNSLCRVDHAFYRITRNESIGYYGPGSGSLRCRSCHNSLAAQFR